MRILGTLVVVFFLAVFSSAQSPVQPTFFGMHFNHIDSLPPDVPVGSIRLWGTGTGWAHLCPHGPSCDWTRLDKWLAAAKRSGITDVVYTFGKTPDWIATKQTDCQCFPPRDLDPDGGGSDDAWKNFVKALVDHNQHLGSGFSKIKYWGVWNEPSALNMWNGSIPQMVRMAKDAYAIIKAADPSAQVLSPELDAWGKKHDDWLDNFISAGGGPYIDIVAFHGYATTRDSDRATAEDVVRQIDHVKEKVARHKELAGKPLWNSECSWGRTDQANWQDLDQANAFVVRFYTLQAAAGIERVYWYMFDPNDVNACCGAMSNRDRSDLPPAIAYREVHKWLLGRTVSCSPQGHVWACNLEGPGYKGKIVWTDEYGKSATYDATGFASYRDAAGASTPLGQKSRAVTIGNKPILLEASK
jgi:hypothetical protein